MGSGINHLTLSTKVNIIHQNLNSFKVETEDGKMRVGKGKGGAGEEDDLVADQSLHLSCCHIEVSHLLQHPGGISFWCLGHMSAGE